MTDDDDEITIRIFYGDRQKLRLIQMEREAEDLRRPSIAQVFRQVLRFYEKHHPQP